MCIAEFPHFETLYHRYEEQGFEVLTINADRGYEETHQEFVGNQDYSFPILLADNDMLHEYGHIHAVPVTVIIDRTGQIFRRYRGPRDQEVFERDVQQLLAEPGGVVG